MNFSTVIRILEQNYTKADLDTSFKMPTRIFIGNHYDFLVEEGVSRLELELLKRKPMTKALLVRFCAIPFSSKTIFKKFRETLVDEVQTLLDALIWVERLHQDEIESKYGILVYTKQQRVTWNNYTVTSTEIKKPFRFFKLENVSSYYSNPEYQVSIPSALRRVLAQYYEKPKTANFIPLTEIEETDRVYKRGEKDILIEMPRIAAYYSQGNIKVTGKGRPALSTIGKMQRKLNLVEFMPKAKDKPLKNLRSILIAGILVTLSQKQISKDINELLKISIFQNNYLNRFESAPIVLHYLKGMGYVDYDEIPSVESNVFQILRRLPVDQWISIENVEDYMRYNVVEIKPILEHTAANKLYYQYNDPNGRTYTDRHYIRSNTYRRSIMEPFIKGSFFFFAAFGLVDIAFNEPDVSTLGQTAYSPYDGLRYVRLTPLGYFVTGNTNTYVPPKGAAGSEITLSSDSLTIVIDPEDDNAANLLTPYANQISESRFQTDFKLFMKECRSKKDLETKINMFQQFVSNELPANWEYFFNDLRQKIDPLEELEEVRVFKIPTDNQALIRLIARDTVLRKLIVKAEGYHLLIAKENMNKFKKRLQEFGYFIVS